MNKRISWISVMALIVALLPLASVGATGPHPNITPAEVEDVVFPGFSTTVEKVVHTPAIPPMPDIYFLADTTGSMGPVIAQVKADASAILSAVLTEAPDAAFGAGDYKDFPYDDSAFSNSAPITDDGGTLASAAIAAWTAGGGYDGPEGQFYALDQLVDNGNWRTGASKIVVWFGDAPAHDPVCSAISTLGYDIDEASLTAKLVANDVRVVAISTVTGAYSDGLDDDPTLYGGDYVSACGYENGSPDQATRIAAATGGVHLTGVGSEDIATAILEGLSAISVDVSMASTCEWPITTSFAPAVVNAVSGSDAMFTETISVAPDAPGGTYECYDYALVDGTPLEGLVYTVTQSGTTFDVAPLAGSQSVVDFYDYGTVPASSNTGVETSDTSVLFLYSGPDGLSLVTIHDQAGDGSGGQATMTFGNLPGSASWVVRDDPGEAPSWVWLDCCTDGGALNGGFFDHFAGGACVTVEASFASGIDAWHFLSEEEPSTAAYPLDMAAPIEICARPLVETKTIKVPEGFLTGGGFIGKGKDSMNFGGNVGFLADFSVVGQWQFHDKSFEDFAGLKMHSTSIDYLQFSYDGLLGSAAPPDANANIAEFAGTARVKVGNDAWIEGCAFYAQAQDHGEPSTKKGTDSDKFAIAIDCGDPPADWDDFGTWDYSYFPVVDIDGGNLQIHSGVKDG